MTDSLPTNWKQLRLNELGDGSRPAIKAGPFGSSVKKEEYVSEGYKVYGQEQVIRGNVWWGDYYISDKKFSTLKSCAVLPGDLLISLVGTLGKVLLIPEGAPSGIINPRLLRLSFDKSIANPMFIQYLLIDDRTARLLQRRSQGGTMGVLNADIVGTLVVDLPPLPEQRKIAEILSAWDRAIEITDQLIAAKQRRKKALMQRLLTGKVRFPGFTEPWEEVRLGEHVRLQGGFAFKSNEFVESGIPIIRISNITNSVVEITNNIVYYEPFTISDSFVVNQGDLLIAMSGATTGKVGRYRERKFAYLNQRVGKFVVIDDEAMDYNYLVQIVTSGRFRFLVDQSLSTSAQPNISSHDIEGILILVPPIDEQRKIAEVLSAADREIESLESFMAQQQEQKKGLMQQLLTGKTRVKVEEEA